MTDTHAFCKEIHLFILTRKSGNYDKLTNNRHLPLFPYDYSHKKTIEILSARFSRSVTIWKEISNKSINRPIRRRTIRCLRLRIETLTKHRIFNRIRFGNVSENGILCYLFTAIDTRASQWAWFHCMHWLPGFHTVGTLACEAAT